MLFTGVNTFGLLRKNSTVICKLDKPNKRMKESSIWNFHFNILWTKLTHNEFTMMLNSVIDFCFDGVEDNNTSSTYGVCWVKDIENDQFYLTKQQINYALVYFLVNWFLTGPRYFARL